MDIPTNPPNADDDEQHCSQIDAHQNNSFNHQFHQPNFDLPNTLIDQASRSYALGDLAQALACYERLVEIEPENNVLHANKSAILLRMKRAEEALEAANMAIQFGMNWPKAYFRKGEALFALGRGEEALLAHAEAVLLSQGVDRQFRAALLKSMEICPQAGGTYFCQLFHQLELADLDEDDCFTLFSAIADSFLNVGQHRIAAKLLRIAIQFPASNAQISLTVLGQLALAESKMGNWEKGAELMEFQLEIALEIEDRQALMDLHGALADLLVEKLKNNNLERAIWHRREQLKMAMKLSIESKLLMEIRIGLAKLLLANGDFAKCEEEFKFILAQEPSNPMTLLGLGRVFLCQGDFSAASALFIRVERLESEEHSDELNWREEAIMLRAKCQYAKGEIEKALELVQKLIDPDGRIRIEGHLGLKAELCGLMCRIKLAESRQGITAIHWAKRQLKAGIELAEENVQAEALNLLLNCYAECREWLNADKIAEKLWDLLGAKNCLAAVNNLKRKTEMLEGINRIFQLMEKWEKARNILELRLKIQMEMKEGEWAEMTMKLAELELKLGEKEKCEQMIEKFEEWLKGEEIVEEAKLRSLPISIMILKSEMEWQQNGEEGKESAKSQMEKALMLAQERELTGMEAWICTRLGEWAEEDNEDDSNVYLKQAIGLGKKLRGDGGGWWSRTKNAKMLLRAFSALGRMLIRQCRWEDALFAVRGQLRLHRELGVNSGERTRTMLLLGRILMENGISDVAEKILTKVCKRAKLANGMEEEMELAKAMLMECRQRMIAGENGEVEEKERDYVNLKAGSAEEIFIKQKHTNRRNYRAKMAQQRRSFSGYEFEQSELSGNCCLASVGLESDAESTISGAFVLGVDVYSEDEENDRGD